jgi:hypothetical protein
MSEQMAQALFRIGQAMHGRRVDVRAIGGCGFQVSVYHVMVELVHVRKGIAVSADSRHVVTSDDVAVIAEAAINQLVHSG